MVDATESGAAQHLSLVFGPPISDEPGLGALTLPGFLREVTQTYGEREALVWRTADGVTRWTYAQLWERAIEVARALRGCGLGKDARVGVLMTNRPEWLAAVFGTALAGGVAVALSTFSTPSELDHLLRASAISVLLFERTVLNQGLRRRSGRVGTGDRHVATGRIAIGEVPVLAPPRTAGSAGPRHRSVE